jgi:hypothetical protein
MKTERSSNRRLIGGLIILLALAAGWAVMHRQGQRAERESRSPLYQTMPVLAACGVHLTADDEHMLGHHGYVALPFRQLAKSGQNTLLDIAQKQIAATLDDEEMTDEQKQKAANAVLERIPEAQVGFQRVAPGSAYIFFNPQQYMSLHVVPDTQHVETASIEIGEHHGAAEHQPWMNQPPEHEHEHGAESEGAQPE